MGKNYHKSMELFFGSRHIAESGKGTAQPLATEARSNPAAKPPSARRPKYLPRSLRLGVIRAQILYKIFPNSDLPDTVSWQNIMGEIYMG